MGSAQTLLQVAGDLVRRLHLEAHVDKPVATYSGGTRRKLSAALALLGKPHLLLLVRAGVSGGRVLGCGWARITLFGVSVLHGWTRPREFTEVTFTS